MSYAPGAPPVAPASLADDLQALVARSLVLNLRMLLDSNSEQGVKGCVMWTGKLNRDGYGELRFSGMRCPAHRVAYMLEHGAAEGLDVHHDCENRACVNPAHLVAMTRGEHMSEHRRRENSE